MIQPALEDQAFLESVQRASDAESIFHLWWLGQSGFLVKWGGKSLLLDPYLSDALTRKYAGTDKPHVRMTERVIAPEWLDFVDTVTSSHNHTDHLDAETLGPLYRANPGLKLVIGEANRDFVAARLNRPAAAPIGLDAGQSADVNGWRIHAIPAAHEQIERDAMGQCKFLGFVVEFGGFCIYHSGDTVLYPGMVETLRRWEIDVALLPINGADPARRVAGNLNGREAAELAHAIGAGVAIPCHYEMFEFNTASPEEFVRHCDELGQPHRVLRAGEHWSSRELPLR
jgi:L-ascorbate metabolism protein UlaG (beta-lactamase superfamily)